MKHVPQAQEVHDLALDELAQLAPDQPGVGSEWATRRDEILESILAGPGPARAPQRRWLPTAMAAASALAVVGTGVAVWQARPDQTVRPAAPVSSPQPRPTPAAAGPARNIPAGHYVVQRYTMRQVEPGRTSVVHRVDWKDSRQVFTMRITSEGRTSTETGGRQPVRDLRGLPDQPAAMRGWFLARDTNPGDSRTPPRIVWTAATDLMRDLGTSASLRRQLVEMLRTNPSTTVMDTTHGGRPAVRITFVRDDSAPAGGEPSRWTDTITLDSGSMAVLEETSRVTTPGGATPMTYVRSVSEPERLTSSRP